MYSSYSVTLEDMTANANSVKDKVLDALYSEGHINEKVYDELMTSLIVTVGKQAKLGRFWKALTSKWKKDDKEENSADGVYITVSKVYDGKLQKSGKTLLAQEENRENAESGEE
jgi:hypothetical protein